MTTFSLTSKNKFTSGEEQAHLFLNKCNQFITENNCDTSEEVAIPYEWLIARSTDLQQYDITDEAVLNYFADLLTGFYDDKHVTFAFSPSKEKTILYFSSFYVGVSKEEHERLAIIQRKFTTAAKEICEDFRKTTSTQLEELVACFFEFCEILYHEYGKVEYEYSSFEYVHDELYEFVTGIKVKTFDRQLEITFLPCDSYGVDVSVSENTQINFFVVDSHVYDDFDEFKLQIELQM